jgi:hypothetical protein
LLQIFTIIQALTTDETRYIYYHYTPDVYFSSILAEGQIRSFDGTGLVYMTNEMIPDRYVAANRLSLRLTPDKAFILDTRSMPPPLPVYAGLVPPEPERGQTGGAEQFVKGAPVPIAPARWFQLTSNTSIYIPD